MDCSKELEDLLVDIWVNVFRPFDFTQATIVLSEIYHPSDYSAITIKFKYRIGNSYATSIHGKGEFTKPISIDVINELLAFCPSRCLKYNILPESAKTRIAMEFL